MKKLFITSLLAVACTMISLAHSHIYITKQGETTPILEVAFTEHPVVTYKFDNTDKSNHLIVTYGTDPKVDVDYPLSNDYYITYNPGEIPTAISEVVASQSVTFNGNTIIVSSLKAGAEVKVFDASGRSYASSVADSNGEATVDMTALPKGLIIIKAGDTSFKVRR